jgi:hypothetical protein
MHFQLQLQCEAFEAIYRALTFKYTATHGQPQSVTHTLYFEGICASKKNAKCMTFCSNKQIVISWTWLMGSTCKHKTVASVLNSPSMCILKLLIMFGMPLLSENFHACVCTDCQTCIGLEVSLIKHRYSDFCHLVAFSDLFIETTALQMSSTAVCIATSLPISTDVYVDIASHCQCIYR